MTGIYSITFTSEDDKPRCVASEVFGIGAALARAEALAARYLGTEDAQGTIHTVSVHEGLGGTGEVVTDYEF